MKILLACGIAAVLAGGVAAAAPGPPNMGDANGDGIVTVAEVRQQMASRFRALDSNRDGRVTKAEFDAAREPHGKAGGRGPRGGSRMFDFADANKDGSVTFAEFIAPAVDRVARLDTNKDGKVSRDEADAGRSWFSGRPAN